MSPYRIALVGLGTVGTGVAKLLLEHPDRIARRAGRPVELDKVVVADVHKPRGVELPNVALTDDIDEVVHDKNIEAVVQVIGGLEPARTIMSRMIETGKHVVTANKALLCEHGDELFSLAREHHRCIAFEAAVAGGIPIILTVSQAMSANQITGIEAILNGTSNFILTEMLTRRATYADVLAEAQQRGYAEADPTMDVDGTDAAQKLVILTQLAFGTKVNLSEFPRQGIDGLDLMDLEFANELGYLVKLLAVSRVADGYLEMHVQPTFVRHDRPLAKTEGAFNMIALDGDAVGRTWYSGPGAGGMPTASAVVADLIDVASGRAPLTFDRLDIRRATSVPLAPVERLCRRYYLRFQVDDRPHVLADIADILGRHGISLASVIQHEPTDSSRGDDVGIPLVVMTHQTTEARMREADAELNQLSSVRAPHIRLVVSD